jgi:hypothetical protein
VVETGNAQILSVSVATDLHDEIDHDGDNPNAGNGKHQGVDRAVILIWQFHGGTSFTALGS